MELDRNALDNYITGHYGEDQFSEASDEGADMPVMESLEPEPEKITPEGAIFRTIMEFEFRLADWRERPDPHGVADDYVRRIAALSQALKDLEHYRSIKAALAVLRSID